MPLTLTHRRIRWAVCPLRGTLAHLVCYKYPELWSRRGVAVESSSRRFSFGAPGLSDGEVAACEFEASIK